MNTGVGILLARMDTHPEEFEDDGKWVALYNQYKKFMEPEEQEMMASKLKKLKMDRFEEIIVKRLMREEREDDPLQRDMFGNSNSPYFTMSTAGRPTFTDNISLNNGATLTIGNQTLEEEDIEQMKRMLIEKLAKVQR